MYDHDPNENRRQTSEVARWLVQRVRSIPADANTLAILGSLPTTNGQPLRQVAVGPTGPIVRITSFAGPGLTRDADGEWFDPPGRSLRAPRRVGVRSLGVPSCVPLSRERLRDEMLLSTDLGRTAEEVVLGYLRPWSMEQFFQQ